MMVTTCLLCRAWYNMDMEEHLDDEHFNMRTGEACHAEDSDWFIVEVPFRPRWQYAN